MWMLIISTVTVLDDLELIINVFSAKKSKSSVVSMPFVLLQNETAKFVTKNLSLVAGDSPQEVESSLEVKEHLENILLIYGR